MILFKTQSEDFWYLRSAGFKGNINDMYFEYLGSLGYIGALQDRLEGYMVFTYGSLHEGLRAVKAGATPLVDSPFPWDETYETSLFTYSTNGLDVSNTDGSVRYSRSRDTISSGKRYLEITPFGTNVFVGLGSTDIPIGGGSKGIKRVGWFFKNLTHSGGSDIPLENAPASQSKYLLAVDSSAKELWVKGGGELLWNGTALSDPATGVGGVSYSGIQGDALVSVGMNAGSSNGATLNIPQSSWTYSAPSGFTSLAE